MTPNVRILRTINMTLDGLNSREYKAGSEVFVPDHLLKSVVEGLAPKGELLAASPVADFPPENQDQGAPPENQAFTAPEPSRRPEPPKAPPAPVRKAGMKPIPVRDKNGAKVGEHELRP